MAKRTLLVMVLVLTALTLFSCTGDGERPGLIQPTATATPPAIVMGSEEPTATTTPLCAEVAIPSPSQGPQSHDQTEPASGPVIMTHFMPWYEAPPITSRWGWHWTMNHYATANQNPDGTRPIAGR